MPSGLHLQNERLGNYLLTCIYGLVAQWPVYREADYIDRKVSVITSERRSNTEVAGSIPARPTMGKY